MCIRLPVKPGLISLLLLLFPVSGCHRSISTATTDAPSTTYREPDNVGQVESVMIRGMRITAITPQGTILIYAGDNDVRTYIWDGTSRSVKMTPRKKRWYGSLGLYYPGNEIWAEHNGISRGVFEEGQMHFDSDEEALGWIHSRTWMPHVYRNDGLVVGWWKNPPDSKTLKVDVWQIFIRGKKPSTLAGAQDGSIVVERTDGNR